MAAFLLPMISALMSQSQQGAAGGEDEGGNPYDFEGGAKKSFGGWSDSLNKALARRRTFQNQSNSPYGSIPMGGQPDNQGGSYGGF